MNYNNYRTKEQAQEFIRNKQGVFKNLRIVEVNVGHWRYRVYWDTVDRAIS